MRLLISDANILIDLEEGGLLNELFDLPFELRVPDILYYEELEARHGHLLDLGLTLGELDENGMRTAFDYTRKYANPSRNDCFALALAHQEDCPLLTGDKALRKAAEQESVQVIGTLWVVEQLVVYGVVAVDRAELAYQRMKDAGRRLPWGIALQRLKGL